MKQTICLTIILLLAVSMLQAAEKHGHKPVPGPQGGKVIELDKSHAELVVQSDRTVRVSFYGEDMKPVAAGEQVVAITAQPAAGHVKLDFEKKDGGFVSKSPLPAGEGYMMVLQLKTTAAAKPKNFRIKLDLAECGGCKQKEYACVCEGHNH